MFSQFWKTVYIREGGDCYCWLVIDLLLPPLPDKPAI